jgi:2,3-bisphosphoglycerate-dependent phosphoglycerate mutase
VSGTRPVEGRGARGRRVAVLVRHGHFDRPENTASAHSPLPLSATGRAQAEQAAPVIAQACAERSLEIDEQIEASSLLRAWQTASVLAEQWAARSGREYRVVERDALIERGLGSAANLTFDRIRELIELDPRLPSLPEGWRRTPDFRLPLRGAESLMDAGRRTAACIAEGIDAIPDEDPRDLARVFVAHSGCLRHAAVVLGALDLEVVAARSMEFVQAVLIEREAGDRWRLVGGEFPDFWPSGG